MSVVRFTLRVLTLWFHRESADSSSAWQFETSCCKQRLQVEVFISSGLKYIKTREHRHVHPDTRRMKHVNKGITLKCFHKMNACYKTDNIKSFYQESQPDYCYTLICHCQSRASDVWKFEGIPTIVVLIVHTFEQWCRSKLIPRGLC